MCLTTAEKTEPYFWYSFMYKFMDEIKAAKEADPNFVRCEGINIIDLKGLSRSALSTETFDVIKVASKISDFFPEVRLCVCVCVCANGGWTLQVITRFSCVNAGLCVRNLSDG